MKSIRLLHMNNKYQDQSKILNKYVPLLVFSLLLSFATAQSGVSIDPPNTLTVLEPGTTTDHTITLENPSNEPMRVLVYLSDFSYDPTGKPIYTDPGTVTRGLSDWVTFNPSELVLGPGEEGTVRYTVNVPEDAVSGTHWGMIFMEGEDPNPPAGLEIAQFTVRVGHAVYVNVPPIEKDGVIAGIVGQAPENPANPYEFTVQYLNVGNATYNLGGRFELRDISGEIVAQFLLFNDLVFPESSRIMQVTLQGPLDPGQYTALFVLNYGDEEIDIAGDYSFVLEEALLAPETSAESTNTAPAAGQ